MRNLTFTRRVLYALSVATLIWLGSVAPASAHATVQSSWSGGWVTCGSFFATSSAQVFYTWTADYATDRWGNYYATFVRPYQGEILLKDPLHHITDACGPWVWTNQFEFDGGIYKTSVPASPACWAFQYDIVNSFSKWGCQNSTYFKVPYRSDYGWGNTRFGATLYPYSAFSGAFSAKTNWYAL